MKTHITRIAAALSITLVIGASYADSVNFTGKLQTKLPTVSITHSSEPVSDVKDVTISVNQNGGVCNITHNATSAMQHGSKPVCKIQWDDPKGLTEYLNSLKGVVSGAGAHTFSYTLTMYDLNTFETFHSDSFDVVFQAPVLPDQPVVTSDWQIKDDTTDKTHTLYNRSEEHLKLSAQVTPRNYTQVVKFGGLTCEIPEGSTTCEMEVNETFTETSAQGSKQVGLTVTDPMDFIDTPPEDFTYNWDFRPPTIVGTHVNANSTMLPEVINDYGQTIVLAHNQAAIVVQSPHNSLAEEFHPTDPKLSVKMDTGELYVTNEVNFGGITVDFDLGTLYGDQELDIDPINEPVQIGSYLLYVYDFSFIRDGLYDFTFSTKDANGNGEEQVVENITVDRYPPDIQFVINGKHHKTSSLPNVYSLSDITILSWGGWNDGSEIISAKLNGQNAAFESGTANVKRLQEQTLPLNSQNYLSVTARDATGNEFTKLLDFNYGNFQFDLSIEDVMQEVQPAKFTLTQSAGPYCVTPSSEQLAILYSVQNTDVRTRGCYVEWLTIPSGIDATDITALSRNKTVIASGAVAGTGAQPYHFKVHSFDAYGAGKVVFEATGQFESNALSSPNLIVGTPQIAANFPNHHYTLFDERQLAISATVEAEAGSNLIIELYDNESNKIDSVRLENVRSTTRHIFRNSDSLPLLNAYDYTVRVYYETQPSLYTEGSYKFFTVPSSIVRLTLDHADYVMDGSNIGVTARIGKRVGSSVDYRPEYGQWEVAFYTFNPQTSRYEPFTQPVVTDQAGTASLLVTSNDILNNQNRIIAKAKLITPYPEVDVVRQLSSLYDVPVLSLGAISASLSANEYSAPVPARFVAKVDYASLLDVNTAGDVIWQKSSDGQTWEEVARKPNLTNYLFTFDEPGELYVRAVVVNQLNGDFNYTNTARFEALPLPLIKLTGSKTVAKGAIGKYQYSMNEYAQQHSNGSVEYSLDNKATWQPMSATEFLQLSNPVNLTIRTLITPQNDAPYYIYDDMVIGIIPPRALSASFRADKTKAEVGDDVTITARFLANSYYQPTDFRHQIIFPDGTVVDDTLSITHQLSGSDFSGGATTFLFRSWVDGLQMESISTREVKINQIVYNGLPPTDVVNQTPDRVNYSTVNIRLVKPNKVYLPASVSISEDIILPPNGEFEVVAKTDLMLRLLAKQVGTHPIEVRYYDNRGNERWHTEFVTVHEPPEVRFDMNTRYFTENLRPPFRLSHSLSYRFGSPTDRLDSIQWLINGTPMAGSSRTIVNHTLEQSGDYTITAKITSKYGQTAEESHTVILLDNKTPVCDPYWERRDRVSTLFANCRDFDGKVTRVAFTYMLDEDNQATVYRYFSPSISFVDGLYSDAVPIQLIATDDSGDETPLTVNWP